MWPLFSAITVARRRKIVSDWLNVIHILSLKFWSTICKLLKEGGKPCWEDQNASKQTNQSNKTMPTRDLYPGYLLIQLPNLKSKF